MTIAAVTPPPDASSGPPRVVLQGSGKWLHFWIGAAIALVLFGGGILFLLAALTDLPWRGDAWIAGMIFVVGGLLLILGGAGLFSNIASGVAGRITLEVIGGEFVVTRRNIFRVQRRIPRNQLLDVTVEHWIMGDDGPTAIFAWMSDGRRILLFRWRGIRATTMACQELREHLWPERTSQDFTLHPPPAGCLSVKASGDTLHVHMRPQQVRQVYPGLYITGVIISVLFLFAALTVSIGTLFVSQDFSTRFITLVIAGIGTIFFVGIGSVLMAVARRVADREADIVISPGRLVIDTRLGKDRTHHEWKSNELFAVRARFPTLGYNIEPRRELEIAPAHGKPVAMFRGRNEQDLAWLAKAATHVMKLKSPAERRREFLTLLAASEDCEAAGTAARKLEAFDSLLQKSCTRRVPASDRLILQYTPAKPKHARKAVRIELTLDVLSITSSYGEPHELLRVSTEGIVQLQVTTQNDDLPHLAVVVHDGYLQEAMKGWPEDQLNAIVTALSTALGLTPLNP